MTARSRYGLLVGLLAALGVLSQLPNSAFAQGAFPAPLPNAPPANSAASPFPPVGGSGGGAAPSAFPPVSGPSAFPSGGAAPVQSGFGMPQAPMQQQGEPPCMKDFAPLKSEADRRAKLIQAAGQRRAPPAEACKLIASFSQAELKMLNFVTTNAKSCGIPAEIPAQMKASHVKTAELQERVCNAAKNQQQQQAGPAAPSLSDALGSSAALPEAPAKRTGGSTFDTINGNALAR